MDIFFAQKISAAVRKVFVLHAHTEMGKSQSHLSANPGDDVRQYDGDGNEIVWCVADDDGGVCRVEDFPTRQAALERYNKVDFFTRAMARVTKHANGVRRVDQWRKWWPHMGDFAAAVFGENNCKFLLAIAEENIRRGPGAVIYTADNPPPSAPARRECPRWLVVCTEKCNRDLAELESVYEYQYVTHHHRYEWGWHMQPRRKGK